MGEKREKKRSKRDEEEGELSFSTSGEIVLGLQTLMLTLKTLTPTLLDPISSLFRPFVFFHSLSKLGCLCRMSYTFTFRKTSWIRRLVLLPFD